MLDVRVAIIIYQNKVVFTSQYTSRSFSYFCIFFGLLGHILCRGLPNALFSLMLPGLEPQQWQCHMVYQSLNNIGYADPSIYNNLNVMDNNSDE